MVLFTDWPSYCKNYNKVQCLPNWSLFVNNNNILVIQLSDSQRNNAFAKELQRNFFHIPLHDEANEFNGLRVLQRKQRNFFKHEEKKHNVVQSQ